MNLKARMTKPRVAIVAGSVFTATLFLLASSGLAHNPSSDEIARAAIIDQLHDDIPSAYFQEKAAQYLKTAGYQVDLYTTRDITVDLYRKLPSMGYEFIVIRSHSGISPAHDQKIENSLGIFTGEKYEEDRYIFEQIFGWVQKSGILYQEFEAKVEQKSTQMELVNSESETYFSIGSKFVDEYMVGTFPGSIILIGGCNSLENPSMADSLLRRGASLIIGWDKTVGSAHNDRVVLETLKNMLLDRSEAKDAVQSAMQTFGPDPEYSAVLNYYPHGSTSG